MEIKPFKIRSLNLEQSKIVQEILFKNKIGFNTNVIFTVQPMVALTYSRLYGGLVGWGLPSLNGFAEINEPELTFEEFERLYVSKEVKFKVGDWVVRKDLKVLKLYPKEPQSKGDFVDKAISVDGTIYNLDIDIKDILRLATPEEIQKVTGEFVLPEKWCIKQDEDMIVGKFFLNYKDNIFKDFTIKYNYTDWYFHNTKNQNGYYTSSQKPKDSVELTLDQFKQYVLKEHSKEDLLTEAKRRFPVNTKFRWLDYPDTIYTNIKNEFYHNTIANAISVDSVYIFMNNKWAEIVQDTLKVSDLVEGEVYHSINTCGFEYIFKFKQFTSNNVIGNQYICIKTSNFHTNYSSISIGYKWKVATQEEKDWLNASILCNKLIEREKALKLIQIINELDLLFLS